MKDRLLQKLTIALMILMIISNIITVYVVFSQASNIPSKVNTLVKDGLDSILNITSDVVSKEVTKQINDKNIQEIVSKAVSDKIDSLNLHNGVDGKDGKDSVSINTIETVTKEIVNNITTIKEVPVNGVDGTNGKDAYFEINCNIEKNRWEVRYNQDDDWTVLNNKIIPCTTRG